MVRRNFVIIGLCAGLDVLTQNSMVCSRSLLLARCLLLLHLIRGAFGVPVVGALLSTGKHLREFAQPAIIVKVWQNLKRAVLLKLKNMGKTITYLAHAEGLCTGFSGMHPIVALCKSSTARANFDRIASAWSHVIARYSSKDLR